MTGECQHKNNTLNLNRLIKEGECLDCGEKIRYVGKTWLEDGRGITYICNVCGKAYVALTAFAVDMNSCDHSGEEGPYDLIQKESELH